MKNFEERTKVEIFMESLSDSIDIVSDNDSVEEFWD